MFELSSSFENRYKPRLIEGCLRFSAREAWVAFPGRMSAGMPIPTGSGQKDPRRAAAILNGQPNPRRPSYLYKGPRDFEPTDARETGRWCFL